MEDQMEQWLKEARSLRAEKRNRELRARLLQRREGLSVLRSDRGLNVKERAEAAKRPSVFV